MLGEYRIRGQRAAEIAASIERAVGTGELKPEETLPPVRGLAVDLGVNPNTVAAAYRTLRERGVIETAGLDASQLPGSVRVIYLITGTSFLVGIVATWIGARAFTAPLVHLRTAIGRVAPGHLVACHLVTEVTE